MTDKRRIQDIERGDLQALEATLRELSRSMQGLPPKALLECSERSRDRGQYLAYATLLSRYATPLSTWLSEPLPQETTLTLFISLADSLAFYHTTRGPRGVLDPSQIQVHARCPTILDLGLVLNPRSPSRNGDLKALCSLFLSLLGDLKPEQFRRATPVIGIPALDMGFHDVFTGRMDNATELSRVFKRALLHTAASETTQSFDRKTLDASTPQLPDKIPGNLRVELRESRLHPSGEQELTSDVFVAPGFVQRTREKHSTHALTQTRIRHITTVETRLPSETSDELWYDIFYRWQLDRLETRPRESRPEHTHDLIVTWGEERIALDLEGAQPLDAWVEHHHSIVRSVRDVFRRPPGFTASVLVLLQQGGPLHPRSIEISRDSSNIGVHRSHSEGHLGYPDSVHELISPTGDVTLRVSRQGADEPEASLDLTVEPGTLVYLCMRWDDHGVCILEPTSSETIQRAHQRRQQLESQRGIKL